MPFPDHRYDFQDSVYISSLRKGGLVQSIRQGCTSRQWLYQLHSTGDHWWCEADLATACPHCFNPVTACDSRCPTCGASLIDS